MPNSGEDAMKPGFSGQGAYSFAWMKEMCWLLVWNKKSKVTKCSSACVRARMRACVLESFLWLWDQLWDSVVKAPVKVTGCIFLLSTVN